MQASDHLERSWLNDSPDGELYKTRHNPVRGAPHRFNEEEARSLVAEWQSNGQTEVLNAILNLAKPLITGVIYSRGFPAGNSEILGEIQFRIWQKLKHFDANKGRLFSLMSLIAHQKLSEIQNAQHRYQERYGPVSDTLLEDLDHATAPEIYGMMAVTDLRSRIYMVKTSCVTAAEIQSQKYLVAGLVDSSFRLKRHEMARWMVVVHDLSPAQARRLYDNTILSIRREILRDNIRVPKVKLRDLSGTRQFGLLKFRKMLEESEFDRLVFLMKNLAPAIIDDVQRVLHGDPCAVPLYTEEEQRTLLGDAE